MKNWHWRFWYIVGIGSGVACVVLASQFIVHPDKNKKQSKESIQALKRQCVEKIGSIVHISPDIVQLIARVQKYGIMTLDDFLSDDKDCFLLSKYIKKNGLRKARDELLYCEAEMYAIKQSLERVVERLELLEYYCLHDTSSSEWKKNASGR